jgi:hypothetical protein
LVWLLCKAAEWLVLVELRGTTLQTKDQCCWLLLLLQLQHLERRCCTAVPNVELSVLWLLSVCQVQLLGLQGCDEDRSNPVHITVACCMLVSVE